MGLLYDEQKYLKQSTWSLSPSLDFAQISFSVVAENKYFFTRNNLFIQQHQLLQIAVHPELGTD